MSGKSIKCFALSKRFAVVCFDSFPGSGELSVMHESATLVVKTPEFAGDRCAMSREEPRGACRLILVEGLAFGIGFRVARCTDVMQLEIGVSGHHNHSVMHSQARKWKYLAR